MRQKPSKSFVISLENRKARGSGHERFGEILEAARELFLEHGIKSVSTRQIAARVGISQTALYVYFDSKEQLIDKLVEGAFLRLGEKMRLVEANSKTPLEYLRAVVPAYIRFGIENPDEYRLAFMMRDGRRKAVTAGIEEFNSLERQIADGIMRGFLRETASSPKAVAQSVWASIHGIVALLLAYPDFDWVDLDELIATHTEVLMNGLCIKP